MSFMARNGRPSGRVPRSWTGGIDGCCNWPVMRASPAKRSAASDNGAVLLVQHLDRDFSAEDGIGGAVDDAHAAAVDLLAEGVALGGGCLGQLATDARGGVRVCATDGVCGIVGGSHPAPRDNTPNPDTHLTTRSMLSELRR